MERKRILIILGHPDSDSYNGALAGAYAEGARQSGAEVEVLRIGTMKFDPVLWKGYKTIQALEPDLKFFQEKVKWANHLVWAYPDWWGSMPALLKGLFDRALLPGFGFHYTGTGLKPPQKLLTGRSARLIVTMDAPPWYYHWFIGGPGYKMMKRAILGFSGIHPIHITPLGPLKTSSEKKRRQWLDKVRRLGARRA